MPFNNLPPVYFCDMKRPCKDHPGCAGNGGECYMTTHIENALSEAIPFYEDSPVLEAFATGASYDTCIAAYEEEIRRLKMKQEDQRPYYEYADRVKEEMEKIISPRLTVRTHPEVLSDAIIMTIYEGAEPVHNTVFTRVATWMAIKSPKQAAEEAAEKLKKALLKRYFKEDDNGDQV